MGSPTSKCPQGCQGRKGPGTRKAETQAPRWQPAGRPYSPSAPMDTSLTPLLAMKSRALFTLEILCTLILPLSGLARRSPEYRPRGDREGEMLSPRSQGCSHDTLSQGTSPTDTHLRANTTLAGNERGHLPGPFSLPRLRPNCLQSPNNSARSP